MTNISSRVNLHKLLEQADIKDLERIKSRCNQMIIKLRGDK